MLQIIEDLHDQKEKLPADFTDEKEVLDDLKRNARLFRHAVINYEMELVSDPTADNTYQMERAAQLAQARFLELYSQFIEHIRQKENMLHVRIVDGIRKSSRVSMVGLVVLICSSIIIAILLSQALNRPLNRLVTGIKRLSAGDLEFQFEDVAEDELGTLQRSFNEMANNLRQTMVSKGLLDDIIHSMADSLLVVNPDGTIQLANEPTVKMLHYPSMDALIARNFSSVLCMDSAGDMTFADLWQEPVVQNEEWSYFTASGERIPVLFSTSILHDRDGEIAGLICLAKDDTERKRIAAKQRLLEGELQHKKKMEAIGTLAGGIAHDFNNLLSVILGYSELTKLDLPSDSSSAKNIDEVMKAAQRGSGLVKQILSFSRKTEHTMQLFSPHVIVEEAMKMLRASLPTTLTITQDIDPQCGSIYADPTKLHQVVVNLCTNAFQAMENQKGTLSVGLRRCEVTAEHLREDDAAPGPFIILSISDTGCGMDKEIVEKIFDPFFTTKEVGKGTGLGLAVIHGIIKDYKGFIRVTSELGKGTIFDVYLPVTQSDGNETKEKKQKEPPTGTERILVVDDEKTIANMHQAALERLGYEVSAIYDSGEALEILRSQPHRFDLLVTDQTMPGLSGAELAQAALLINPALPIILCSGYSAIISEKEAVAIGVRKYARKPVDRVQLAELVRMVLDEDKAVA